MIEFFHKLFSTDFMPHVYCLRQPGVVWLHACSDALIALSYFLIPIGLIYLVRRRRDLSFSWMFLLFGIFIFSCGSTHVMSIVTLWHPVYRLDGLIKAFTAVASISTAFLLLLLLPKAIGLASPEQLRQLNLTLQKQIERRNHADEEVRVLNADLERRIQDLSKTAASLEAEAAEHRNTERHLRESEQRYRLLFEDSSVAKVVFDPETPAFLAVNPAAVELFGYTCEEFQHLTLGDTQAPGEVPAVIDFFNSLKAGGTSTNTFASPNEGRKPITIESRVKIIQFDGRKAYLSQMIDVTEHLRAESQLRQSHKMEAVGQLAGGIAHDFNNLLTVILGYSESILRKLGEVDPIRAEVSEIQGAGQHAANLTRQLLAFSRKQILQPRILELNTVVTSISQMLRRVLGEDIKIALHLDSSLGNIQADPTQLEQVLLNLAVNARDAMPDGGQLVIETHNRDVDQHAASVQSMAPGQYVVLEVSDTGSGMNEETKARVFEPFFTTKELDKGTGLGLSTVLGVVQQSGGTVTIYSEVGVGTTFKIYLPRVDAPATQPALPETVSSQTSEEGATILLVEDEPSVRALAREVLRSAGYLVYEASNGAKALQVAADLTSQPALLLTDVVMPEMNGLKLSEELHKKWPELAVLYTSGYSDHALLERGTLQQDMPFLQKPYMPAALLERVAATLRGRRGTVLIVDDDKEIREHLCTNFQKLGYRVLEAADGPQAMTHMSTYPVRLVVIDLVLPGRDGVEIIRALRRSYPDVKILATSAAFGSDYVEAANHLGADLVLPNSSSQEEVMHTAETLLV